MIKGGGGALLMEKIIAYASGALSSSSSTTRSSAPHLCERFAIPVEVVADAVAPGQQAGSARWAAR